MNDKTKWFGRYLGCEIAIQGYGLTVLTGLDSDNIADWVYPKGCDPQILDDCKLILKELKDISEEDLEELNELRTSAIDWTIGAFKMNEITLHLRYEEIDFLRSRGYAIGIPKEYYITESELKNN